MYAFLKGLDLSLLKILSLLVKGLQSYSPSNFEDDKIIPDLNLGRELAESYIHTSIFDRL